MLARDIMTSDPKAVTPGSTVSDAARIMRDLDVGAVPVVEEEGNGRALRGLITDRDIAVRHVAEGHSDDCRVSDHMTDRVTSVSPDDDVDGIMDRMRREQVRRVPVVEDGNRLVGIIAQADLAVDAAEDQVDPEEVEKTVEKISEPAEPRR